MPTDVWTTAQQGAVYGTLIMLVPAAVLCVVAVAIYHNVDARHPSFAEERGMRLHTIATVGGVSGLIVGLFTVLPIQADIATMGATVLFAAAAGVVTWNARTAFSGAVLTVAAMGTGVAITEFVYCLVETTLHGTSFTGKWLPAFGSIWPMLALPGFVIAGIVAFLSTQSVEEPDASVSPQPAAPSGLLPHAA